MWLWFAEGLLAALLVSFVATGCVDSDLPRVNDPQPTPTATEGEIAEQSEENEAETAPAIQVEQACQANPGDITDSELFLGVHSSLESLFHEPEAHSDKLRFALNRAFIKSLTEAARFLNDHGDSVRASLVRERIRATFLSEREPGAVLEELKLALLVLNFDDSHPCISLFLSQLARNFLRSLGPLCRLSETISLVNEKNSGVVEARTETPHYREITGRSGRLGWISIQKWERVSGAEVINTETRDRIIKHKIRSLVLDLRGATEEEPELLLASSKFFSEVPPATKILVWMSVETSGSALALMRELSTRPATWVVSATAEGLMSHPAAKLCWSDDSFLEMPLESRDTNPRKFPSE